MAWKVEVLPEDGRARKPYKYGQCAHAIPRVFRAETLIKHPHLKTCQRAASVVIDGEKLCKMHGGEKLLAASLEDGGWFRFRIDLEKARQTGIMDQRSRDFNSRNGHDMGQ